MKVYTQATIEIAGEAVPQGSYIELPETLLPEFAGRVAYINDGVLRVPRHVNDLAALIAGLTSDDPLQQKLLLERHCEAFDRHHIGAKWKEWEKRTAVLERTKGMSREEAEQEAARELHLSAFLADRG